MSQSVERLTLDFCSGHDLTAHGTELHVGLCLGFSLPLSLCPSPAHTLPFKINKLKNKRKPGFMEVFRKTLKAIIIFKHFFFNLCLENISRHAHYRFNGILCLSRWKGKDIGDGENDVATPDLASLPSTYALGTSYELP